MRFPFKTKIVLWYTLVVLVTLFVFRVVSIQFIRQSLYEDLDNSLRGEADWAQSVLLKDKAHGLPEAEIFREILARSALSPRKEFIEIYNVHTISYLRSPNLGESQLHSFDQDVFTEPVTVEKFRDHSIRLFAKKDSAYWVYIGYPTTDIEAALDEIISSFFLLVPAVLILLVAGGLFLVSRFLRSVDELAKYTDSLLDQPLEQDLPEVPPHAKRELGVLIDRITPIVERMRNSMKHVLSFASLASHELRTPLAIVRNELENALRTRTSTRVIKSTLASSYNEILRMNRTVEDLLSLGTMQAGTFKLQRTRVEFHTLLQEFYDEALILCREKNISVVLSRGPSVSVEVDVDRIRQTLFNLLDNAIKHTDEGGRIRLNYAVENNHLLLHFADTGHGISPIEIHHIFDPFHRGKEGQYGTNGAGLGLALVKWIVQAHGGTVTVESELKKGTKFIIQLPIAPQQPSPVPSRNFNSDVV